MCEIRFSSIDARVRGSSGSGRPRGAIPRGVQVIAIVAAVLALPATALAQEEGPAGPGDGSGDESAEPSVEAPAGSDGDDSVSPADTSSVDSAEAGDVEPAATSPVAAPPPPVSGSQPYFRPMPSRRNPLDNRSGWFMGIGVGIGSSSYDGAGGAEEGQGGFFFDARFGGMLTSRLGLAVEFWSDGHRQESFDGVDEARTQNTFAITGSYWLQRKLWLKLGLGASSLTFYREGDNEFSFDGNALLFGVGYEVMHRGNWAFDVSLRVVRSSFDNDFFFDDISRTSVSFNVGGARF